MSTVQPNTVQPNTAQPHVRVVVLNFDGGQMTLDCLDSLLATDWPADRLEIVVVDNGSLDNLAERIRAEYPRVRLVELLENRGFAGGCNTGMALPGDHDMVALINNDATVEPGWLAPMVNALRVDPRRGAVSAKLLFAHRYHGVEITVPDASRLRSSDPRTLGVRVCGVRLDGRRVDDRLAFDEGFFADEPPVEDDGEEIARWTSARASLRIASDGSAPKTISLLLSCLVEVKATLKSDVEEMTVAVGPAPQWIDIAIPAEPFDVVNNVGSNLYERGFGGDRGFLEVDRGQYDEPAEVFAWCGGAVLMSRAYLDDVGLFDESLFLYYEDTDLSWRGRLRGWTYWYVPEAVVRHRHAQSSGVGSPVFRYYTERNRLLVLVKNAPARLALRALGGEVERFVRAIVKDLFLRPLTLRWPLRSNVAQKRGVLRGVVRLLPHALRQRYRRGRVVRRREVMRWEVAKW